MHEIHANLRVQGCDRSETDRASASKQIFNTIDSRAMLRMRMGSFVAAIWELPQIGACPAWVPRMTDPSIWGPYQAPLCFRNSPLMDQVQHDGL